MLTWILDQNLKNHLILKSNFPITFDTARKPLKVKPYMYIMDFEIDHIIDDIIETIVSKYKDCSKCGLSKLKSEFYKDKKRKDGLTYECKGCSAKRYQENKEAIAKRNAIHRKENKEKIVKQRARYYKKHKEEINKKSAIYWQKNKKALAKKSAIYRQKNKEAINKLNATYRKNRRRTDAGYRIEESLRSRMNRAMNRTKNLKVP